MQLWQHITGADNGKSYNYIAYWGFQDTSTNSINMGNIYVPVDHQLTDIVKKIDASTSNVYGNTVGAVRDASGTALSEARQAKVNAANASNNAWYNGSAYGGSAQSVGNVAGYIAYSQLPAINTGLSQKIDNLNTTINNMIGADTSPPVVNLATVSGAQATSGNSIKIVVGVSDNISDNFIYSLDNSTYQPLPPDRMVTVSLNGYGSVPINVWVKDEAGNTETDYIAIRKL